MSYLFIVKPDNYIYSSGRDKTYFPVNLHHWVFSEETILEWSKERLLKLYNKNSEIPLTEFKSDEEARERVTALLNDFKLESKIMAKRKDTENQTPAEGQTSTETTAASTERKSRVPKSAVIRLKATANPKRPGSAAHTRFALYQDGMTVDQFVQAGGTMGDINFDSSKGHIALEGLDNPEPAAEAAPTSAETPAS